MKIALPSRTDAGPQEKVFGHFGSAPFFAIFDTDSQSWNITANANQSHPHGHCRPTDALAQTGADVVITAGIGAGAIANLMTKNIKVYQAPAGSTLATAVASFQDGKLALMDAASCHDHDHHHGHGNGHGLGRHQH